MNLEPGYMNRLYLQNKPLSYILEMAMNKEEKRYILTQININKRFKQVKNTKALQFSKGKN